MMMIQKLLISAAGIALISLSTPAQAFDEARMGPAQRMHAHGERASSREQARARVRRGSAISSRSRPYDEIRPAGQTGASRFVKTRSNARRSPRPAGKARTGSRTAGIVVKK